MAVTQQLARLTPEQLGDCRSSLTTIARLCSFTLRGDEDHLDLDWAPAQLERAAHASGLPAAAAIVDRACSGGIELNPAYRFVADTIWWHPVTGLEPTAVREVASGLMRWNAVDVVRGLDHDPDRMAAQLAVEAPVTRAYLREHYTALAQFYVDAAERGMAMAMWWD